MFYPLNPNQRQILDWDWGDMDKKGEQCPVEMHYGEEEVKVHSTKRR